MSVMSKLKENYRVAKAEVTGKAISRARRIKTATEIGGIVPHNPPPVAQVVNGSGIRMLDGKPMVFYTDGSLRHALGRKTAKAARKALKRARRAKKSS